MRCKLRNQNKSNNLINETKTKQRLKRIQLNFFIKENNSIYSTLFTKRTQYKTQITWEKFQSPFCLPSEVNSLNQNSYFTVLCSNNVSY